MLTYATLLVTDHGAVRRITLNRPDKRNAFSARMATELSRALSAADADDAVHVVIVTGAGESFCSGVDVTLFLGTPEPLPDIPASEVVQPLYLPRVLGAFRKPIIAAVNGPSVGLGMTVLPHFDLVYASQRATFTLPFVKLGLVAELGSSFTLPRLIGEQRTRELILRGAPIDAATACDWGLVARVFPHDTFDDHVLSIATEIANNPPHTVVKNKALLRDGAAASTVADAIALENDMLGECYGAPENVAAVTAFLKRRRSR